MLLSRRTLFALSALYCAPGLAFARAAQSDPAAAITRLYRAAMSRKGKGGAPWIDDKSRAKDLSKSLTALWAKADARTPKADIGPISFDVTTNSQGADVKSFEVTTEAQSATTATVVAQVVLDHWVGSPPEGETIRYALVYERKFWKIDNVSGTVRGKPWSLRGLLTRG
jgi:hypothetical protein